MEETSKMEETAVKYSSIEELKQVTRVPVVCVGESRTTIFAGGDLYA